MIVTLLLSKIKLSTSSNYPAVKNQPLLEKVKKRVIAFIKGLCYLFDVENKDIREENEVRT